MIVSRDEYSHVVYLELDHVRVYDMDKQLGMQCNSVTSSVAPGLSILLYRDAVQIYRESEADSLVEDQSLLLEVRDQIIQQLKADVFEAGHEIYLGTANLQETMAITTPNVTEGELVEGTTKLSMAVEHQQRLGDSFARYNLAVQNLIAFCLSPEEIWRVT